MVMRNHDWGTSHAQPVLPPPTLFTTIGIKVATNTAKTMPLAPPPCS